MSIDERVMSIADAAKQGQKPRYKDVLYLLSFDPYSVEAAYLAVRAREIALVAAKGIGLVEAQIGVDASACPQNCRYCSFAALYANKEEARLAVVPLEEIVSHARVFDAAGAHLISLMATAGLPFEQYREIVRTVREAISNDLPLLINCGDITASEARQLKEAGAQAA